MRYPRVGRAGLTVTFDVIVTRSRGFEGPISIAVSSGYLGVFSVSGMKPDPIESTQTEERAVWRFEAPEGDVFRVSFDARVDPSRHWGEAGRVWLLDSSGEELLRVGFHTWIAP